MLYNLNGEIVLVSRLAGAIVPVLIDANDVIHTAAVPRNTNNGREWPLPYAGRQKVSGYRNTGTALEQKLLAPASGKIADLECGGAKRRSLGKSTQKFNQFGAQLVLPKRGLALRLCAEG